MFLILASSIVYRNALQAAEDLLSDCNLSLFQSVVGLLHAELPV